MDFTKRRDPTPAEIQAAARKLREKWSDKEWRKRSGGSTPTKVYKVSDAMRRG